MTVDELRERRLRAHNDLHAEVLEGLAPIARGSDAEWADFVAAMIESGSTRTAAEWDDYRHWVATQGEAAAAYLRTYGARRDGGAV